MYDIGLILLNFQTSLGAVKSINWVHFSVKKGGRDERGGGAAKEKQEQVSRDHPPPPPRQHTSILPGLVVSLGLLFLFPLLTLL